jgi:hypothetical protein
MVSPVPFARAGTFVAAIALGPFACTDSNSPSASRAVPGDIDGQLAHTPAPDRLPILLALPDGNVLTALGYDQAIDDPITRWASCIDIVGDCYSSDATKVAACVRAVPKCADDHGAEGCCAPSCFAAFEAKVAADGVDRAIEETFLAGACYADLPQRDAGVQP